MINDDDPKASDPPKADEAKPDKPTKEKKVARKSSKVRTAKGRSTKAPAKAKSSATRSRIDPDAKVTKTGKGNPFREGSGAYERTEIVLKNSGKTAGTIAGLKGVKSSTLSTLKRMGVVKIG